MGRVSYAEQINATPAQVWAVLSDVKRLPDWAFTEGRFPYPVEGRYGNEQHEGVGTIWVGVSADGQTATQKITDWQPPHRLAYELQQMENAALQMAQTCVFDLEPSNAGTRITWTVDWKLIGGWSLNAILIRLTGNGVFEEMIAGSLEKLKQVVEGEAQVRSR
jgi:uncharacterized protein YndB with AHSA1/START domain